MINYREVEHSIRDARDHFNASQQINVTPEDLVSSLSPNSWVAIEQIRLSHGSSLIAFFQSQPTREQVISVLDQTLQDLTLLRKKK